MVRPLIEIIDEANAVNGLAALGGASVGVYLGIKAISVIILVLRGLTDVVLVLNYSNTSLRPRGNLLHLNTEGIIKHTRPFQELQILLQNIVKTIKIE